MKNVVFGALALTMVSGAAHAACSDIPNPTRFNPTELSDYQECWLNTHKADEIAGVLGSIAWVKLDGQYFSASLSEIRMNPGSYSKAFIAAITPALEAAELVRVQNSAAVQTVVIEERIVEVEIEIEKIVEIIIDGGEFSDDQYRALRDERDDLKAALAVQEALVTAASIEEARLTVIISALENAAAKDQATIANLKTMLDSRTADLNLYHAGFTQGLNSPVFLEHMGVAIDDDGNYYMTGNAVANGGFHSGGHGMHAGAALADMIADNHISVEEFMEHSGYNAAGFPNYNWAVAHVINNLGGRVLRLQERMDTIAQAAGYTGNKFWGPTGLVQHIKTMKSHNGDLETLLNDIREITGLTADANGTNANDAYWLKVHIQGIVDTLTTSVDITGLATYGTRYNGTINVEGLTWSGDSTNGYQMYIEETEFAFDISSTLASELSALSATLQTELEDAIEAAYESGYEDGYSTGYNHGYADGFQQGRNG